MNVIELNHPELLQKRYEAFVEQYMDSIVQERNYNSVESCIGKYLFSPNAKFKAEAEAVNQWNSACWDKCNEIFNKVNAGEIPLPSYDEVISELPTLEW